MNIKKFRVSVYATIGICMVLAIISYYFMHISSPLMVLSLPIEGVAMLLRKLSLSSPMGDIIAWGLYGIVGLLPVLILAARTKLKTIQKHRWQGTDLLLVGLSAYLFFLLYVLINPSVLASLLPAIYEVDLNGVLPVLKTMLSGVAYALLVGYMVIKVALSVEHADIWKQTERILQIGTLLYVIYICYAMPFEIFSLVQKNLSDADYFVAMMGFLLKLLPMACLIGIMESIIMLIHALKENKYDGVAAKAAMLMATRSKNTVIVSVFCNIAINLLQLILMKELNNINYSIDIPFLPLILAFIGLIATEYLKESSLLYDDNKMII